MGDKINKEYAKKSTLAQSIEQALNNFEYVDDDTVIEIVKSELEKFQNEEKLCYLGFSYDYDTGAILA
jgi:adenylate kinase family enzyme